MDLVALSKITLIHPYVDLMSDRISLINLACPLKGRGLEDRPEAIALALNTGTSD
jgi:hypothetical protein